MKKLLLAALLATSFGSVALPASAQVYADRAPPPAARRSRAGRTPRLRVGAGPLGMAPR